MKEHEGEYAIAKILRLRSGFRLHISFSLTPANHLYAGENCFF
jgi:hypothetical protein